MVNRMHTKHSTRSVGRKLALLLASDRTLTAVNCRSPRSVFKLLLLRYTMGAWWYSFGIVSSCRGSHATLRSPGKLPADAVRGRRCQRGRSRPRVSCTHVRHVFRHDVDLARLEAAGVQLQRPGQL